MRTLYLNLNMEENDSFKMEPPLDHFYNNQGREWSEKQHWVKTEGKTPEEVLLAIKDELSLRLGWKKKIQLLEQVQSLLHLKYDNGTNTTLYNDMNERIENINRCRNYKSDKKISEILQPEISEAQFNIEWFIKTKK